MPKKSKKTHYCVSVTRLLVVRLSLLVVGALCALSCAASDHSGYKSAPVRSKTSSRPASTPPSDVQIHGKTKKGSGTQNDVSKERASTAPPTKDTERATDPSPSVQKSSVESVAGLPPTSLEGDIYDDSDDPYEAVEALVESIEKTQDPSTDIKALAPGERPPSAGMCQTVCDAGEAICSSSSRICTISSQNPSEPYFVEKCSWSKQACAEANTKCSRCMP